MAAALWVERKRMEATEGVEEKDLLSLPLPPFCPLPHHVRSLPGSCEELGQHLVPLLLPVPLDLRHHMEVSWARDAFEDLAFLHDLHENIPAFAIWYEYWKIHRHLESDPLDVYPDMWSTLRERLDLWVYLELLPDLFPSPWFSEHWEKEIMLSRKDREETLVFLGTELEYCTWLGPPFHEMVQTAHHQRLGDWCSGLTDLHHWHMIRVPVRTYQLAAFLWGILKDPESVGSLPESFRSLDAIPEISQLLTFTQSEEHFDVGRLDTTFNGTNNILLFWSIIFQWHPLSQYCEATQLYGPGPRQSERELLDNFLRHLSFLYSGKTLWQLTTELQRQPTAKKLWTALNDFARTLPCALPTLAQMARHRLMGMEMPQGRSVRRRKGLPLPPGTDTMEVDELVREEPEIRHWGNALSFLSTEEWHALDLQDMQRVPHHSPPEFEQLVAWQVVASTMQHLELFQLSALEDYFTASKGHVFARTTKALGLWFQRRVARLSSTSLELEGTFLCRSQRRSATDVVERDPEEPPQKIHCE